MVGMVGMMEAVRSVKEADGIMLEGTRAGQAMAALMDDARQGKRTKRATLFWNTYSSIDFEDKIAGIDSHRLPREYYTCFAGDDQPLEIRAGKQRS